MSYVLNDIMNQEIMKKTFKIGFHTSFENRDSFTILSNIRWYVLKQLWTIRMCSVINKSYLYILTLIFAYELQSQEL